MTQLRLIGFIKSVNSKYSHCHCVDTVLTECKKAKCCVDIVFAGQKSVYPTQILLVEKILCTQLFFVYTTYFPVLAHVSIPISVLI